MKRIIPALFAAIIVFLFSGCSEDPKANVRWVANSASALGTASTYITDIAWKKNGIVDQVWAEKLDGTTTTTTSTLEVQELTGQGDCVDSTGAAFTITIDTTSIGVEATSGNSAVLKEDANVILVINSCAAK